MQSRLSSRLTKKTSLTMPSRGLMYAVKVKFSAYSDDDQWGARKGFEYKWTGEVESGDRASSFLDGLREFIIDQVTGTFHVDLDDDFDVEEWLNSLGVDAESEEVDKDFAAVE